MSEFKASPRALQLLKVPPEELKVTFPPGTTPFVTVEPPVTAGDAAATVAEYVTTCPRTDGFTEELTTVLVGARVTVTTKMEEVLVAKLTSPE